ncbi:MAG: rhamnogalacturonan acetylesterase [Opitutaceae bacterium]|jgi:lysophospholipase L1-like esterase
MKTRTLVLAALAWIASSAHGQPIKFAFGTGPAPAGWTRVAPDLRYSDALGYGFEGPPGVVPTAFSSGGDPLAGNGVEATAPFYFSFRIPEEGNWRVTVTLGNPSTATLTTISAEIRRLLVLHAATRPGETREVSFIVNTRTPKIPDGTTVRLKPRETQNEANAWDDRITLEFNDTHPAICSLTAERAENVPTIYLIGDSTMTDQPGMPTTSWGQFLPIFFKNTVAIANHGESGESYHDFRAERRLAKLLSVIKPGDWVISQMGHNDEKERARGPAFGAFKNYADEMRAYTREIRAKGAHIILVTPMQRHSFVNGRVANTHDDYPDAVRAVARELDVPLIDLTAMSDRMMNVMGDQPSWVLFSRGQDSTHHSPYGAWELAKCVAQGIRDANVEPAKWLSDDFTGFDPGKPDPIGSFTVPNSPSRGGPPGRGRGGPRGGPPADDASKPYGS